MSSTYISTELRKRVFQRAKGACEYCLVLEQFSLSSFAIDHIIAEKHGGQTQSENLALSCPSCNLYKGSDIASIDPETGSLARFYNPRRDEWAEHFLLTGGTLIPLSAIGRVTTRILRLNRVERVEERRLLSDIGLLRG